MLEQIASKEEKMQYETVLEETTRVCFSVVGGLLEKTGVHPSEVYYFNLLSNLHPTLVNRS